MACLGHRRFLRKWSQKPAFSTMRACYQGRLPGGADLVTYWFEKTRAQIVAGKAKRAGLVATNRASGAARTGRCWNGFCRLQSQKLTQEKTMSMITFDTHKFIRTLKESGILEALFRYPTVGILDRLTIKGVTVAKAFRYPPVGIPDRLFGQLRQVMLDVPIPHRRNS